MTCSGTCTDHFFPTLLRTLHYLPLMLAMFSVLYFTIALIVISPKRNKITLPGLFLTGTVAIAASVLPSNPIGFVFLLVGAGTISWPVYEIMYSQRNYASFSIRKRTK